MGWGGQAGDDDADEQPEAQPTRRDATGVSIERQQALIQANLAYWEHVKLVPEKTPTGFKEAASQITMAAKLFAHYLATGIPTESK
jgi:hypothetical protein